MIFKKGRGGGTIFRENVQTIFVSVSSAEFGRTFILINTIYSVQHYFHFLFKVLVFILLFDRYKSVIIIGVLDLKPHRPSSILNTESGEPGKNQFFKSSIEHFQITRVLFLWVPTIIRRRFCWRKNIFLRLF